MKTLTATGTEAGITMSCHHKAYLSTPAEWWVRVAAGNIKIGDKEGNVHTAEGTISGVDFAKNQLRKNKLLDSITINGEKIK